MDPVTFPTDTMHPDDLADLMGGALSAAWPDVQFRVAAVIPSEYGRSNPGHNRSEANAGVCIEWHNGPQPEAVRRVVRAYTFRSYRSTWDNTVAAMSPTGVPYLFVPSISFVDLRHTTAPGEAEPPGEDRLPLGVATHDETSLPPRELDLECLCEVLDLCLRGQGTALLPSDYSDVAEALCTVEGRAVALSALVEEGHGGEVAAAIAEAGRLDNTTGDGGAAAGAQQVFADLNRWHTPGGDLFEWAKLECMWELGELLRDLYGTP